MDKLNFKDFSTVVEAQYNKMVNDTNATLVRVAVDMDVLWNKYLDAYPQNANGIFRERRAYDCNCCKNFIRRVGNLVALNGTEITSVWDVTVPGYFQDVANVMAEYVKAQRIDTIYATSEGIAGGLSNFDNYDSNIKWDHFYVKVPTQFIYSNDRIGTYLGEFRGHKDVLERSLQELTLEAGEVVLELINSDSLYRGTEHRVAVESFVKVKREYDAIADEDQKRSYVWQKAKELGQYGRYKNSAIGTLLSAISEGEDLTKAVNSFESIVAGPNYKRSSAVVTPSMIKQAQEKIRALGLEPSLERRLATKNDITVNNVLFTSVHKKALNVFDDLLDESKRKVTKKLDKVEPISLDKFVQDVLPTTEKVEVLFETKHKPNLMTLVAPVHTSAPNMFKWNNQYSWTYNGDVTDRIKERVKAAGGNVNADLRVSLSWYNADDLDLSCVEPDGNVIMYSNKRSRTTEGHLDLDMNGLDKHDDKEPVENLIYESRSKMKRGDYAFRVHQYSRRRTTDVGFAVQIEFDGQTQTLAFDKPFDNGRRETVVVINWDGQKLTVKDVWNGFTSNSSAKENLWNVTSGEFIPVSMIMNSPNHWDGNSTGNKHLFFILEGCKNQEPVRGFYNEYLKPELNDIRKTIEVLGAKLKIQPEPNEEQLSGLGFSETIRDELTVRVSGKTQRVFKINL